MPVFAAFLAALCFALSAIFARRSTELVGSEAANFARLWVVGAMLAVWAYGFRHGLQGAGFKTFIASGIVGFGLGDVALFAALPLLGSRLTALMVQCLAAPLAALIEWLWLGTRLSTLQLGCGLAILAGVAIALAPERIAQMDLADEVHLSKRRRKGTLIGAIAALGQAGGAVISRKAFALSAAGGLAVDGGTAAFQRALGGLMVVTAVYLFSMRTSATRGTTRPRWKSAVPWILTNSLAGALGVSCYQWALGTTPSAVVLPIVALTPLMVVPFAYLFEGEKPGARSLWGGLVAVIAAALLSWSR